MFTGNDNYENFEAAWENAYATIASEKLKYKNKVTKYRTITNEQMLETI